MIVTDIRYHQNKKYEVYLNDEFAFELYKSEIKACGIDKGQEMDLNLYEKLIYEVVGKRAKKRAMHILEKQDKTEHQLREKLKESRYPKESIECAIAYMKEYHYIDDLAYGIRYVEYRSKDKSKRQLMQELYQKGISLRIADEILQSLEIEETSAIEKLILKKCRNVEALEEKQKQKIIGSLMRKGFSYSEVEKVFRKLVEEETIGEIT